MELMSQDIKEIVAAIAKAQGAFSSVEKNKTNPHFKSKYADLGPIWDMIRKPLSENGLSLIQSTQMQSTLIKETNHAAQVKEYKTDLVLKTILFHTSGQWIGSIYPIYGKDQNPQSTGSALTYARRYALSALIGIVSEEDDDGNAASPNPNQNQQKGKNNQQAPRPSGNQPPVKPLVKQTPATPGDYVFQFGKFKDLMIKEVPYDELSNWHQYMTNQPNRGGAQEAFEFVSTFINHYGDFNDQQVRDFANAPDPEWSQNV